jgi:hypothetical protein
VALPRRVVADPREEKIMTAHSAVENVTPKGRRGKAAPAPVVAAATPGKTPRKPKTPVELTINAAPASMPKARGKAPQLMKDGRRKADVLKELNAARVAATREVSAKNKANIEALKNLERATKLQTKAESGLKAIEANTKLSKEDRKTQIAAAKTQIQATKAGWKSASAAQKQAQKDYVAAGKAEEKAKAALAKLQN